MESSSISTLTRTSSSKEDFRSLAKRFKDYSPMETEARKKAEGLLSINAIVPPKQLLEMAFEESRAGSQNPRVVSDDDTISNEIYDNDHWLYNSFGNETVESDTPHPNSSQNSNEKPISTKPTPSPADSKISDHHESPNNNPIDTITTLQDLVLSALYSRKIKFIRLYQRFSNSHKLVQMARINSKWEGKQINLVITKKQSGTTGEIIELSEEE